MLNVLLVWAAKYEKSIEILIYVDDSFGVEEEGWLMEYKPYGEEFTVQQVELLKIWDEVGVLHKRKRQVFGDCLTILGIMVLGDAPHRPTSPPIFLRHLCIFLLIVPSHQQQQTTQ